MIKLLVDIIGNLGSGKTLIMLILSLTYSKEIWSNFKINIPNYRKLEVPDLFSLKDNIVVLMDEAYAWIESRISNTPLNEYNSSILFHSRKTFTDIYLTTPMLSAIDKRFRHQANYLIECLHRPNQESDDFHFIFNNLDNNSYGYQTLTYENAKKYFKLYNTYEKVESSRKLGLEFKILKQYPNRLKERVLELTEIVRENIDGQITHDIVKDCLLMNGLDMSYEPYIYIRLKGTKNDNNN